MSLKPKIFDQRMDPWGQVMYSSHGDHHQTIGNSGAAPTLCADIVATLKDPAVTPAILAEIAIEYGDRTYACGTSWSFFHHIALYYDFSKFVQSRQISDIKECIDAGGYAVCSVRDGYWGRYGMLELAYCYSEHEIFAVNCNGRIGHQSLVNFEKDLKMCFCYYPDTYTNCF